MASRKGDASVKSVFGHEWQSLLHVAVLLQGSRQGSRCLHICELGLLFTAMLGILRIIASALTCFLIFLCCLLQLFTFECYFLFKNLKSSLRDAVNYSMSHFGNFGNVSSSYARICYMISITWTPILSGSAFPSLGTRECFPRLDSQPGSESMLDSGSVRLASDHAMRSSQPCV